MRSQLNPIPSEEGIVKGVRNGCSVILLVFGDMGVCGMLYQVVKVLNS